MQLIARVYRLWQLSRVLVALFLILTFTACNSQPTPTPTPSNTPPPPTLAPEVLQATDVSVVQTFAVPAPGTMVQNAIRYTPGFDPRFTFDVLFFQQTSSETGAQTVIELQSNGTITRDGRTGTLDAATVQQINSLLNQLDFYGLEGIFVGSENPAAYRYYLRVDSARGSRSIDAQDGFTPAEMQSLFTLLLTLDVGNPATPNAEVTETG